MADSKPGEAGEHQPDRPGISRAAKDVHRLSYEQIICNSDANFVFAGRSKAKEYNPGRRMAMTCRLAVWALLGGCLCAFAGEKPIPSGQVENKHVAIRATVYTDKEAIKQLLGSDLGGFYVVVQAEITPRETLKIFRDDFMLRSDRDGEKAKPYTASEMLGSSVMVVSQTYGGGGGGVMNNPTPGGGVWGPPIFLPGAGSSIGNGSSEVSNDTTIKEDAGKKKDPMLAILESKIMPEKETEQPISGLLYFPMDPKQKPKQLELYYTTPSGRISLRFKQ